MVAFGGVGSAMGALGVTRVVVGWSRIDLGTIRKNSENFKIFDFSDLLAPRLSPAVTAVDDRLAVPVAFLGKHSDRGDRNRTPEVAAACL